MNDFLNEKKMLIKNYTTQKECEYMCSDNLFECEYCDNIEECYAEANDRCDREYAEILFYSGCNTEEEFWEQFN